MLNYLWERSHIKNILFIVVGVLSVIGALKFSLTFRFGPSTVKARKRKSVGADQPRQGFLQKPL
jgi:hypothetical protein